MNDLTSSRSWLEKISQVFNHEPQNIGELLEIIKEMGKDHILDREVLQMIEGAISVSELQTRDIMVPLSHLVVLQEDMPFADVLKIVMDSGHSRFPIMGENRDDVIGILLAKDLLHHLSQSLRGEAEPWDIKAYLRPPMYVPESKRLNALLKEFRAGRNHLALVVDEYGGLAGLVTLEDVLEEIVGDISDEYDKNADSPFVRQKSQSSYIVESLMPIDLFNEKFETSFSDEHYDTIGGWVLNQFGRVPARGEKTKIGHLEFKILAADNRRIKTLQVNVMRKSNGI